MQVWPVMYTNYVMTRMSNKLWYELQTNYDMQSKYDMLWIARMTWYDMIHEHVMTMHDALDLKGAANCLF